MYIYEIIKSEFFPNQLFIRPIWDSFGNQFFIICTFLYYLSSTQKVGLFLCLIIKLKFVTFFKIAVCSLQFAVCSFAFFSHCLCRKLNRPRIPPFIPRIPQIPFYYKTHSKK